MWRQCVSVCQSVCQSVIIRHTQFPTQPLLSWFNVSKMAIQLPARNTVNNVANNTKPPTCWQRSNLTPSICHVIPIDQWGRTFLTTWGSVLTDIIKRFELLKVKTIDWTHTRCWLNRSCNTSKFVVNLALYFNRTRNIRQKLWLIPVRAGRIANLATENEETKIGHWITARLVRYGFQIILLDDQETYRIINRLSGWLLIIVGIPDRRTRGLRFVEAQGTSTASWESAKITSTFQTDRTSEGWRLQIAQNDKQFAG